MSCCIIIWFAAPLIVNLIFSSDYLGLEDAIVLFSIALTPGILSTILITQVAIYLDIVKQAYNAVGFACIIIFLILLININNLDAFFVIKTMVFCEWLLLIIMILLVRIRIYAKY
jgi:hypothetical protein